MTVMKLQKTQKRAGCIQCLIGAWFPVLAIALLASGCSGGSKGGSLAPQQPAGSQGSTAYTYVGTQSLDANLSKSLSFSNRYGGTWAFTLDQQGNYFSYQNFGHEGFGGIAGNEPEVGTLSGTGLLTLTATSGTTTGAAGYAIEIPGDAAVLRPGNDTIAPVISLFSSGCTTLSSTTYQFISLGTPALTDKNTHVAYGSVQLSSTGTIWSFNNLSMYTFAGASLSPTALPTGNCGFTQLGYVVNTPPSAATGNFSLTTAVSPSGYFVMDQGQGEPANQSVLNVVGGGSGSFSPTGPFGLVGVERPSKQLDTGSIVAGKYLGFEYDDIDVTLARAGTLPVSVGTVAGSGTVMTGGSYPNDDATQTPFTNITIDLGQQDANDNGLYTGVTVTVPDTYSACATTTFGGTDANGNPTCIFHGAAVAGNPNGKFAIFVTVNDVSQAISHYTPDAALSFFLYQQ
jgi:hypothetical protein